MIMEIYDSVKILQYCIKHKNYNNNYNSRWFNIYIYIKVKKKNLKTKNYTFTYLKNWYGNIINILNANF